MRLFSLAFVLLLGGVSVIFAQSAAPFQFDDNNALAVDRQVLDQLTATDWFVYQRGFLLGGKLTSRPLRAPTLSLQADGVVEWGRGEMTGRWSVVDGRLLHFYGLEESDLKHGAKLLGAFAVHEINEDRLILVKTLTSSHDNRIIYHLASRAQILEWDRTRVAQADNFFRSQLLGRINNLAEKTGEPLPEEMEAMPTEELEELDRKLKEKIRGLTPNENVPEEVLDRQLKEALFMRGMSMPPGQLSQEDKQRILRKLLEKN